jgi:hypothetical protein
MVAGHDLIHELLQKALISTDGPKGQRLNAPLAPAFCIVTAIEPNPEGPASPQEPVSAWCRDKRQLRAAQCGIQIHAANGLQEFLFQKPFLHPHKGIVIIFDCDRHRRLRDKPPPELLRQSTQEYSYTAQDHEQQSARRELILAA